MDSTSRLLLLLMIIVLSLVAIVTVTKYKNANNSVTSLSAMMVNLKNQNAIITVVSVPDNPWTVDATETLKIYGYKSNLITVNSEDQLRSVFPSMSTNTIRNIHFPIALLPNGTIMQKDLFYSVMKTLPIQNLHEGVKIPYIIIYGIENCPYTSNVKNQLDARGIPYQYVDINSDPVQITGEVEARMHAIGVNGDVISTPIVEVNGYIDFVRSGRLTINDILSRYQTR